MAKNTYRSLFIGAALSMSLAATGALAADSIGDDDDDAVTTAPVVYPDRDRDVVVTEEAEVEIVETRAPAEFALLEPVGGEWLRPRFVVHSGPHGPQ